MGVLAGSSRALRNVLCRWPPVHRTGLLKLLVAGCLILSGSYLLFIGLDWMRSRKNGLDIGIFQQSPVISNQKHRHVWKTVLSRSMVWPKDFEEEVVIKLQQEVKQPEICVRRMGRLGNRIFQVAGLLGIAQDKGMKPFLEIENELVRLFELPDVEIRPRGQCSTFPSHNDLRNRACDKETYNFSNRTNRQIVGYFQSWKYFRNINTFIRRQFQLRPIVRRQASVTVMKSLLDQSFKSDRLKDSTLVAVHVRRTDAFESGASSVPVTYLQHATQYFRSRFTNVIFVAASDDISWTRQSLLQNETVFLTGNSAELDFAILSMCDHTIMTIGTFGWWIAWLVNGVTVYYKYPHVNNTQLARNTVMEDYIPKGWIGMV